MGRHKHVEIFGSDQVWAQWHCNEIYMYSVKHNNVLLLYFKHNGMSCTKKKWMT